MPGWPTREEYAGRGQAEKDQLFWRFVHQALLGPSSSEQLCREHVLGGTSCLLPDAQCVAREVFADGSLGVCEKLWRAVLATWLGCGGPAFRSYRYLSGAAPLFGRECPESARLPRGDRSLGTADLAPMYSHLESIVRSAEHKPKDILSGDGRFTMGRFGEKQGLSLLCQWRDAVSQLFDRFGGGDEELAAGLEKLGPEGIDRHFRGFHGWSDLAIKELFTYMELLLPSAFNSNRFVPFGDGACAGGKLVLGEDTRQQEMVLRTRDLLQRQPDALTSDFRRTFQVRMQQLPEPVRQLPGYAAKLASPNPLSVLDVEVCFCWFQAFLKNKVGKWKAFRRDVWTDAA